MARIKRISVGIGIFCYNEEENIESAIISVLSSQNEVAVIKKIIVVSSGSFDRTNRIVRKFQKKEPRLVLIEEAERRGKSAAINLFLQRVKTEVVVTLSGDLRVRKDSIEEMVVPFLNQEVGMVGGHPVPKNVRFSAVGEETSMLWELHHLVSLKQVKCGEMVAFRNVIQKIPANSAVDEATLEVLLRLIGFSVVYAPRAIVYNKVPRTLAELITQRRRVEAGHLWVKETYNYTVSTMNTEMVMRILLALVVDKPSRLMVMIRLLLFEAIAKGLGWFDYVVLKRNPYVWDMISR
jgi:cellulose synthase/poly-beta-1,6-N-acetylglucosamine synthase-like glycosyltransferase